MSQPEIGELFVGAYLRIIKKCPIVQYNVHDTKVGGQGEIDVLGIDYETKSLYVCEVATHLDGAHYTKVVDGKTKDWTIGSFEAKLTHARRFVARALVEFPEPVFMIWSPYVASGGKTARLDAIVAAWPGPGRLELRINEGYSAAMQSLIDAAAKETKQRGEGFYRTLQLLTHMRGAGNKRVKLRLGRTTE